MITILLQQILDLLSDHFPGVITLLEKLNLIEPDVEEIRQDVDVIRTKTTDTNNVINSILNRFNTLDTNIQTSIKPNIQNISDKTDIISNSIGTISTNTGRAASFAEDCANNTLDIDQKINTIASDTTQIRSDNQVLIGNTNDIESYLLAMAYGLVKTTAIQGNPIKFNTDLIEELPMVRAEITPAQAGSGTPSPTNPRALSGISDLTSVFNGDTKAIALGGTVYEGDLDLLTGSGISRYNLINFDGTENWVKSGNAFRTDNIADASSSTARTKVYCNCGEFLSSGIAENGCWLTSKRIYFIPPSTVTTAAEMQTWVSNNNLTFVYPLETPTIINASPETFESIPGDNILAADPNVNLTAVYKESVANYISNNT